MSEWFSASALANLVRLVVTWLRARVRVRVEVRGPIGLDQPHGHRFEIAVSNKGEARVGVVRAELEVESREGLSPGKWLLVASPHGQVTIEGHHQETWTLPAIEVRQHLVDKGLYEARVRGVARLGTGRTRRSKWQRIDRPRALSV